MRISPRHTNSSMQLSPQEYEQKLRKHFSGWLTEDEIQDVLKNPPKLTEAQKKTPHSFSLEDNQEQPEK